MKYYKFECGCRFAVLSEQPLRLDLDIESRTFDCPATWAMLSHGFTKGVFQLESNLGRSWCKKLKPNNIEHLTALGAILRPGCLQNRDSEGVSVTEHYCRRKNGEELVEDVHTSIKSVLAPTYGLMVFQEQAMEIPKNVAGFNLQDADVLRKAIGKKLPEEMKKVEFMFLEGAIKAGVISKEEAESLFEQIKKSQRYSFNKSHSYCYAILGYWSAFTKAHFPREFFTSYLRFAHEKKQKAKDEIQELIAEAKLLDIKVDKPDLRQLKKHFWNDGKTIFFGLSDIKGIGEKQVDKLLKLDIKIAELSWYPFLTKVSDKLTSVVMKGLICSGSLDYMNMSRRRMLAEYDEWYQLEDYEREWIKQTYYNNLIDALRAVARMPRPRRRATTIEKRYTACLGAAQTLETPLSSQDDTVTVIVEMERKYLSVPITYNKVDECDTSEVNIKCKEYLSGKGKSLDLLIFGVQIQNIKLYKTKKGRNPGAEMAFVTISDGTASLDVTVFPEAWKQFASLLTEGNTVIIQAIPDKKQDSCIVNNVFQM